MTKTPRRDANPRFVCDILQRLVDELKKDGIDAIHTKTLEATIQRMRADYE